jgi:predicted permease
VCLLFLIGGTLGLALAYVGTGSLVALVGNALPRATEIRVDGTVLGFTLGISLLTGLVFGLSAAFQGLRKDLAEHLRVSDRSGGTDRQGQQYRGSLVVAEIALSLVLLGCGGFLLKSYVRLSSIEPGFDPEMVMTMRVVPRAGDYQERSQVDQLYGGIIDRISAHPGVSAIGAVNLLPMTGRQNCEFVWRDEMPIPQPGELDPTYRCLEVRVVTPEYFSAMGIPLLSGRRFSTGDGEGAAPVGILNVAAVDMMSATDETIGGSVTLFETRAAIPNVSRQVIGTVGDVRHFGLANDPVPALYVPFAQEMDPGRRRIMSLAVQTSRDPAGMTDELQSVIRTVEPDLVIEGVRSMEMLTGGSVAAPRFRTTLLLLFGAVALVLSAVGVAGTVGFSMARRIPELGLRIALGAQKREIYATVMRQGIRLTSLGLILGIGGVFAASRVLSATGLLYAVAPTDLQVLVVAPICLAFVAIAAIWLPARHAIRIDPVKALSAD